MALKTVISISRFVTKNICKALNNAKQMTANCLKKPYFIIETKAYI